MYAYRLGLALVKGIEETDGENLEQREDFIREKMKVFNETCRRSRVNPKYIGLGDSENEDDVDFTPDRIYLTLYSQQRLDTPGRALRFLVQLLVQGEEDKNLSDLVSNGHLFRTFIVAAKSGGNDSGGNKDIAVEDIDDVELVKALLDYLMKKKSQYSPENNAQRNAVNRMKALAIESGIIAPKGILSGDGSN